MAETASLTLTDFLLARIADEESLARGAQGDQWPELVEALGLYVNIPNRWHIAAHGPARVLAECEAKRRIVKSYQLAPIDALLAVLLLMAEVYADHPDYRWRLTYREEWRP